ncbi:ABA4-like family protein [Sorangium sp. So ce1335]|uniref:ABA4-like family protein n=1 Tax=Sorangium sp. So ce1335 TaxID=3133335 RepID=UPI003F62173F
MDLEALFSICNAAVVPGWLLLAFAPRWRWTQRATLGTAAALALVYLVAIIPTFGKGEGGFGSLHGVAQLFARRDVLLVGWIHYLVFDLFTGSWEARDAARLGIPHWAVVPCLALTLFFGPVGFLAYLALRAALRRRFDVDEAAPAATPARPGEGPLPRSP